jgi:hypothetical protein
MLHTDARKQRYLVVVFFVLWAGSYKIVIFSFGGWMLYKNLQKSKQGKISGFRGLSLP